MHVIFETMNDRGLSLTQVEMLRSYLLANIDADVRLKAMDQFDRLIRELSQIKLSSKCECQRKSEPSANQYLSHLCERILEPPTPKVTANT